MFGKKHEEPTTRLRELSSSNFTIAKGESDIRGWDVRDAQQIKFGTVQDLIFDIRANKVRYMVINILDTRELDLEKRTVMVPIGLAELDPTDNDVLLPTVNPFQLRALPRYDRAHLGAKAERDISIVFGHQGTASGSGTTEDVGEQFYNHDHFNNNNLYRRRNNPIKGHQADDALHHRYERQDAVPASTDRLQGNDNLRDFRDETDEEYFRRTGKRRGHL